MQTDVENITIVKQDSMDNNLFLITYLLTFIASCINRNAFLIFLLVSSFTCILGNSDRAVAMTLLFFRGVLSIGVAVDVSSYSMLRLATIMLVSLSSIIGSLRSGQISYEWNRRLLPAMLLLTFYIVLASLLSSSYPVVSIAKWFSYLIPFLGCLLIVQHSDSEMNVLDLLYWSFLVFFLLSILLLPRGSVGYLRNGRSFQGVFNHPNVLGILCVCFYAIVITRLKQGMGFVAGIASIVLIVWFELLTKSRTGLLGLVICSFIAIATTRRVPPIVYVMASTICFGLSVAYLTGRLDATLAEIGDYLFGFITKGGEGLNVDSREGQIRTLLSSWHASPWTGTGFMVPYENGKVSWSFSMSLVVEPGNIVLALLGYTGLIGLFIFFLYSCAMVCSCRPGYECLIAAPFLISLGEMTFFSTNNCGILCYLLIAVAVMDSSYRINSHVVTHYYSNI